MSQKTDKVWHNGLLHKMECLGISGSLMDYFRTYLSNRFKRVAIKGCLSSWLPIRAGVPQGSILGPLLYLIYSNDLDLTSDVKLFADDTILSATGDTALDCVRALQPNIELLSNWAKKWKVSLNTLKTKCFTVSRKRFMYAPLTLNGRLVEEVTCHFHLGLRLQSNGKWDILIGYMIDRASKLCKEI